MTPAPVFTTVPAGSWPSTIGILARSVADGAFRVGMEIAAADADGIDPHLDFAGARVFDRFFSQMELALRDEFGYQHYEVPTAIVR